MPGNQPPGQWGLIQMNLQDLKALPQWVGHLDKVPKDPRTGGNAQTNNPATWATAGDAWRAKSRYGWDGIGYVFTIKAGVIGIDLDDCFDDDHNLKPWARDVVQCVNSYTEYSPSGRGLHILTLGSIPHSIKQAGFEMYNELRYFTVTGREYGASAFVSSDIEERQTKLDALFVTFGGDFNDPPPLPDVPMQRDDVTESQVQEWLSALPAWGEYHEWLSALMAVHSVFPDERGVRLCESWSPGKPGEVRRKFRSFDRTARDGVGIGTLIHMAKANGWQKVRTHNTRPERSTL